MRTVIFYGSALLAGLQLVNYTQYSLYYNFVKGN